MKGKTLGAITGLVAALGLAGCTETHDTVNMDVKQFLSNAGWKYVAGAETAKGEYCSSQYPGFFTRVVNVKGINPAGNIDKRKVCCIIEYSSNYRGIFGTDNFVNAGYCDFLKQ
ncbi:MAG: hypothetical protein WC852_07735 [Candidatus Nanoarchaeia archaeon]|jgi:hypothetical protein